MKDKLSSEEHIENLKKTTKVLLSSDENISQSNGWKLREILLHLWSWDEEFIKACEAKIAGEIKKFQFDHIKQGIDMDTWNVEIIDQKKDLSLEEVKKLFKETREKTIRIFEKVITVPETIENEESFLRNENIVTLWQHDKHHLEQAGQQVNF